MLNHPDTQVQYIITTLENQRDNLMIENGNLSARVKVLEAEVAALQADQAEPPREDAPAVDELAVH